MVCGHETLQAMTSTGFNWNAALLRRPVFWHKILATINHRDVRSPQEIIVLRALRNSVEYIILLSTVRNNLIKFVITTLILLPFRPDL